MRRAFCVEFCSSGCVARDGTGGGSICLWSTRPDLLIRLEVEAMLGSRVPC